MFNVRRTALAAALIAALGIPFAWSAGIFSTLPLAGGNAVCTSILSGVVLPSGQGPFGISPGSTQGSGFGICGLFEPAGPAITGNETFPADTNLAGQAPPQTVRIQTGALAPGAIYQGSYASPKNLFRNGDVSANPFQMGTSQAANISNTITTGADGFRYLGAATSAIQWSKQTGATDIVANQFTASLRFQRASRRASRSLARTALPLPMRSSICSS